MVENNRFSGLGDKLDESEDDVDTDAETTEQTPEPDPTPTSDPIEEPAFEFSATEQTPIYVRSETLSEFEKAVKIGIDRALVEEYDITNSTKSEIHDAMVRLAIENPEDVAELIVNERRSE